MSATQLGLTITQGEDWSRTVAIVGADGNPATLTGYSATMTARPTAGANVVLFQLTSNPANGISIAASTGILTLTVPHATSSLLWAQDAVYDLIIVDQNGIETPILAGALTVIAAVTR